MKYKHELSRYLMITTFAGVAAFGCAQSEPIDLSGGQAGSGPPSSAPSSGAAGDTNGPSSTTGEGGNTTGTAGTTAEGGTTGAAGATGTTGAAGSGSDPTGVAGTSGVAGSTGAGHGGSVATGRGGSTGAAGSTGVAGSTGHGGSTGTPDGGTTDGGTTATFTQVYTTILSVYCTGSSCHNPGTKGNVNFASQAMAYSTLKSRVVAGNSASSTLYTDVNTGKMPDSKPKLSAANIALIKAWIDAGALNN
jgi:hypothetical protein